jgi:hypothetical protein
MASLAGSIGFLDVAVGSSSKASLARRIPTHLQLDAISATSFKRSELNSPSVVVGNLAESLAADSDRFSADPNPSTGQFPKHFQ